jgi:hypothetical protein
MKFLDHLGRPIYAAPKHRAAFWRSIHPTLGAAIIFFGLIGVMGAATQLNLATQVKGILAIANGGTGTGSTLTGLVRGSASAMTAAELSGDVSTSGSNAVTVAKINGTSIPTNSAADQLPVTTASATAAWATIPNCTGALAYSTSTHTFSCNTILTGTFADAETPSGSINSSNVTFTLAHTPNPGGDLQLYVNGQQMIAGGADYTLATATITMVSAPKTGDVLTAFYRY